MTEPLHLLIVDSDAAARASVRRVVEAGNANARLSEGSGLAQALAWFGRGRVDCVLLDESVGLDALRLIRERSASVAIVLLASTLDDDVMQAAFDAGITDFLQKSDLTPRRLAARVAFAVRVGRAEAETAAAAAAAQRAAAARDEVLAVVSHDLRGPLHAIGLATEALRDEVPESGKRYLGAIERAAARAERLITDLLEASAIENGALRLATASVDALSIVRQAAQDHELLARETGGKITAHVPEGSLVVRADRDRVLQVLGNLIGNALKHAKGAPIDLLVSTGDVDAKITVRDKGPGIPAPELPHIFDRYWRGRTRKSGAGLGLAIAKGIVSAHGGELNVHSQVGDGSEFTFTLPLVR